MKKRLMFLALAALGLASCNGGLKKAPGGLLYNIINDKSGPSIKVGDFVSINFIVKNDADSVMASSYEMGHQVPNIMPKPQYKGDIYAGILLLSEGDSAIIKLNIDSISKGHPKPPGFKGKYVVYTIKVEKVIAKGNLSDQVFNGRYQAYMKSLADAARKAEPVKIKKYIADNNLKFKQTPSGLYYIVTKQGSGPNPATGDTAVMNYTVKSISGKVIETNVKSVAKKEKLPISPMNPYKPIRFPMGAKGMIQGVEEGIKLLNKGSSATLVLPSNLAYGEQGSGQIQPFASLIFDVELVDIIHPDPNAPKPVAPTLPQRPSHQQSTPVNH